MTSRLIPLFLTCIPLSTLALPGVLIPQNLKQLDRSTISSAQPETKPWHDTNEAGIPYETKLTIDPTCRKSDSTTPPNHCRFVHSQVHLPGDNTPYDEWYISHDTPGPVWYVHCEVFSHQHLITEDPDHNSGTCHGYINGDGQDVVMIVKWKQQW
jgi:hypothetical protein